MRLVKSEVASDNVYMADKLNACLRFYIDTKIRDSSFKNKKKYVIIHLTYTVKLNYIDSFSDFPA